MVLSKRRVETLLITLLAVVFTGGLIFVTLEGPRLLNSLAANLLDIPDYNPAIDSELIEEFMNFHSVRLIGYACLAVLAVLIIVGFVTQRTGLLKAGSVAFFLPTFGYFVAYMFFLSGLGILRVVWLPVWDPSRSLLKLGDITYLPYMVLAFPLSLIFSSISLDIGSPITQFLIRSRMTWYYWNGLHLDIRMALAYALIALGLLIFVLGTINWFYSKIRNRKVVDFWLYRRSRHPQYLGWLIWSYGVMLLASLTPVVRGGENPGASLPWLISSIIVVCIALTEELKMRKEHGDEYLNYQNTTPFMLPLPRLVKRVVTFPARLCLKKERPESRRDIAIIFLIYAAIAILLSTPFAVLNWPGHQGWSVWPYNMWPFT